MSNNYTRVKLLRYLGWSDEEILRKEQGRVSDSLPSNLDKYLDIGRFGFDVDSIWSILAAHQLKDPYLEPLAPLSAQARDTIQAMIERERQAALSTPTPGMLMVDERGWFVYDNGKWVQLIPTHEDISAKLEAWSSAGGRGLHWAGDEVGQPVSHRPTWEPTSGDRDVPNLAA